MSNSPQHTCSYVEGVTASQGVPLSVRGGKRHANRGRRIATITVALRPPAPSPLSIEHTGLHDTVLACMQDEKRKKCWTQLQTFHPH